MQQRQGCETGRAAAGIEDPPDPHYDRYKCTIGSNNINQCSRLMDDVPTESVPPGVIVYPRKGKAGTSPAAGLRGACEDAQETCCSWASKGECDRNAAFMKVSCRAACGECAGGKVCTPPSVLASPPPPEDSGIAAVRPFTAPLGCSPDQLWHGVLFPLALPNRFPPLMLPLPWTLLTVRCRPVLWCAFLPVLLSGSLWLAGCRSQPYVALLWQGSTSKGGGRGQSGEATSDADYDNDSTLAAILRRVF